MSRIQIRLQPGEGRTINGGEFASTEIREGESPRQALKRLLGELREREEES